ncbi:MAG: response regulator [Planctomycetota bacterium]
MHKILIADSDPDTREWYSELVRSLGHVPLVCEDAIAVLDYASSNPDLDLVLMDVDLPGAWGEQLITIVRSLDCLGDVPILVASAPRSQVELMRLLANGARRWFRRTPEARELIPAINECLERCDALSVFDVPEPELIIDGAASNWLLG